MVAHRGNRRYPTTYGDLAELSARFAAELQTRGVAAGERVVLWGANSAEWIAVFFGCLLRGVIVVPLDTAGSIEFADRVVKDVAPRLIVGDRDLLRSLTTHVSQLPLSELTARLPSEPMFTVSEAVHEETPFQIVFTSGTTSEPKGIVHTHRNVLASLQPIEDEIGKYRRYERWVHPLRFLHSLPLSHVFGQFMGLWVPPLLGAEVHFDEHLEPARIADRIHRERISVLVAVPRVLQLLRVHLLRQFSSLAQELERSKELSMWKRWWRFRQVHRALGWKFLAVISGGASLPAELEGFFNRLGFALIQGYGMTETAALVTLNHPFHIGQGTIGKALPGHEVRISGEGEILVRGDMLAKAMWQGGAIHPREDEWLATGDLATMEESGELRFLGRKGDVIVTAAGMDVHPTDLEKAMTKQPGVRACVVVPCAASEGEEPVAVALFAGSEQDLHAAVVNANHELAEYQRIRRVLRWPEMEFPYTSTGKLLRRKVRQWACETIAGQRQGASANAAGRDELIDLMAQVTGERVAGDDDQLRLLEDFHLDSLGRVQLQSVLEQRLGGIELEDDAMARIETLGDLRALVKKESASKLPSQEGEAEAGDVVATPPSAVQMDRPRSGIETAKEPEADTLSDVYPHWPWSWPVRMVRMAFLELVARPLVWLLAAPRVTRETTCRTAARTGAGDCESPDGL